MSFSFLLYALLYAQLKHKYKRRRTSADDVIIIKEQYNERLFDCLTGMNGRMNA